MFGFSTLSFFFKIVGLFFNIISFFFPKLSVFRVNRNCHFFYNFLFRNRLFKNVRFFKNYPVFLSFFFFENCPFLKINYFWKLSIFSKLSDFSNGQSVQNCPHWKFWFARIYRFETFNLVFIEALLALQQLITIGKYGAKCRGWWCALGWP